LKIEPPRHKIPGRYLISSIKKSLQVFSLGGILLSASIDSLSRQGFSPWQESSAHWGVYGGLHHRFRSHQPKKALAADSVAGKKD